MEKGFATPWRRTGKWLGLCKGVANPFSILPSRNQIIPAPVADLHISVGADWELLIDHDGAVDLRRIALSAADCHFPHNLILLELGRDDELIARLRVDLAKTGHGAGDGTL